VNRDGFTHLQTVTYPTINRACRGAISLIDTKALWGNIEALSICTAKVGCDKCQEQCLEIQSGLFGIVLIFNAVKKLKTALMPQMSS